MLSRSSLALLHYFAAVIVDSGYADYAPHRPRRYTPRAIVRTRIALIARDVRLNSGAMHTRRALIDEIMERYGVTYHNACRMMHQARKIKRGES